MNIQRLTIQGFKSIGNIEIENPNPFTVFVGPNASGKSNIFEAIEFFQLCNIMYVEEAVKLFGNSDEIINFIKKDGVIHIEFEFDDINPTLKLQFVLFINELITAKVDSRDFGIRGNNLVNAKGESKNKNYKQLFNYSKIFIQSKDVNKRPIQDDSKLSTNASNLEKVLKRILLQSDNYDEIHELLQLLIPGFSKVEIVKEELSGTENIILFEDAINQRLNKRLISDGTYNLLALIAAVYQSDEPQFLCIEEPENGLNPKVVRELVNLFRTKCKEKGHYIWLNTHSQTLVSELTPEEIILVDKVDGFTQCKQIKDMNLHGLRMDEALLTNALGGGIPW